jgi:hypothetical protein
MNPANITDGGTLEHIVTPRQHTLPHHAFSISSVCKKTDMHRVTDDHMTAPRLRCGR